MAPNVFGQYIKELRRLQDLTLRGFCELHGLDPGNHSRLERGLRPLPRDPAARQLLARQLGLQDGTDDWQQFFDLADISAGRIPDEIADDEELAAKLPLVFRTLRGEKLTPDTLRELADLIRKG